jgi:small-conductance mechanosensitive channel/CRP-like cAMP-binding protein
MDWSQNVVAELGAGAGAAIGVGALLILALRLILPKDRRYAMVAPLVMLVLHLLLLAVVGVLPKDTALREVLELAALGLILLSFARSGFLLLIHAVVVRRLTRPMPRIFQDVLQAVVYMGVALAVLSSAGVEPGSILTTSALLTAVIGLSMQDTLGNMFAGLAIQAQRPFDRGDWIQYGGEPDHIGKVIEMNWRAVTVQTLERVEMVVPNSNLANTALRNFSKPTPLVRREAFLWAPYGVPPHRVRAVVLEAMRDVVGVVSDPAPSVLAREFTERGVKYWARWFITDFDQREPIAAQVRERIWYAMHRAGIAIPPPARHVTLEQVSPESRVRLHEREVAARERALEGVDFLEHLPDDARRRLAEQSQSRLYAPNELILREGEHGHELFIIERGEVRVLVDRADMSVVEVAQLGPGAFFGEMSLLTGEPRRATVRAVGECEILVVDRGALQPVLAADPDLAQLISRKLAEREAELGQRVAARRRRPQAQSVEERSGVLLDRIRKFFHL